jgi:hypothetical protein
VAPPIVMFLIHDETHSFIEERFIKSYFSGFCPKYESSKLKSLAMRHPGFH